MIVQPRLLAFASDPSPSDAPLPRLAHPQSLEEERRTLP